MDLTRDIRGSVILTDTESRILYASRGMSDRMGFDQPEVIGKRPSELWGGHMGRPFYVRMWQLIAKGVPFIGTVRNRRKNGQDVETPLYIAPLHGEAGVEGYLALQPEADSLDFRDEFLLAANAEAAPVRLQDLLEDRFGWKADVRAERRSTLLDLLARTLVDPLRQRFQSRVDDAELIRQAKADGEAFGLLVAKYLGTVRRYFQYRLSDADLAEDLAQETFERAFRALPRFESSNASYQTYLLQIAHNLLVSEYRRGVPPVSQDDVAHMTWLERLEAKDEVDRAMGLLEPLDREVLKFFYQEGYSIREIAARFSASENAIKLRLSRARRRMAAHANRNEKGVA